MNVTLIWEIADVKEAIIRFEHPAVDCGLDGGVMILGYRLVFLSLLCIEDESFHP